MGQHAQHGSSGWGGYHTGIRRRTFIVGLIATPILLRTRKSLYPSPQLFPSGSLYPH